MGLITHHYASGYRCDKGGCHKAIQGGRKPIYLAEEHYKQLAIDAGWTFTYRRRLWVHCPDHRPAQEAA